MQTRRRGLLLLYKVASINTNIIDLPSTLMGLNLMRCWKVLSRDLLACALRLLDGNVRVVTSVHRRELS